MATEEKVDFSKFTPEEIRTLQLRLLGILDAFDAFCRANHLTYFLSAGTMLGAVREKAFIRWDDDMDVSLPRKDYEKLFRLWNNENNRYQLLRPTKNVLTGVHIGQLRDAETTCIYPYARDFDICQGIKIDIEPIDGCPDGKFAQKIQWLFCRVYGLMAAQRVPNKTTESMKKQARIILSLIRPRRLRYWLFRFAERQLSKYDLDKCSLARIDYYWIFDRDVFSEQVMTEFEGRMVPIPKGYDRYLKVMYGDYMKLPPEEKRKPETVVSFYDPDTSYREYKGIKYCVNQPAQR